MARNAAANGILVETALLDWSVGQLQLPPFDVVLAADVLYEERNAMPLLRLLDASRR